MSKKVGVVTRRAEKTGAGLRGPWKKVDVVVDEEWYSGFTSKVPALEGIFEGTKVAMEFTENGRYKNISSIEVLEDAPKPKNTGGGHASANQEAREWHISLGAGLNQAVALFPALVEAGAISLPSKDAAKYDAAMNYVKEIATELATFNFFSEVPEEELDELAQYEQAVGADVSE